MSNVNTPVPVPVPVAISASAEKSSVPAWMNVSNPDGTWNMAGLFFWLVMLAILVVLANTFGLVKLWAVKKMDGTGGNGEDFYSDL